MLSAGMDIIEEAKMIVCINGTDRDQHQDLVQEMYRQRARVFSERMKWDVVVRDGMEYDNFDEENPLYLISVDEVTGRLRGSLRLLPTTGPNMLRDVFPELLPPDQVIESPTVWESSRFSMDVEAMTPLPGRRVSYVTCELIAGITEISLQSGIGHIVSVFDAAMYRVLKAAGAGPDLIGGGRRIGVCTTYAGLFEMTDEFLSAVRHAGGIEGSVLEPNARFHLAA